MTIYNTIADTANNLCMMNKTSVTDVGGNENQHTFTTIYNDEGMSHEMEETMSEEAEEIDVPLTDRDTVMENLATRFVKHMKEEPEKKLVVVRSHMCGLDSVRSMDGDTFRVVRDAKKKCVNIMFDEETTEPVSCEVDNS